MRLVLLVAVIGCGITVQKEAKKEKPSIAIVGAGMAGLSTARRLIEMGSHDIDIYEGSNRIGGRIHPIPYYGGYLQMGAQFINGARNPIYKIANKMGLIAAIVSDQEHLESAEFLTGNQPIDRNDIDLFLKFVAPLDPKYRELAKTHDLLSRVYTLKSIFMEDYQQFIKTNNITGPRRKVFDALTRPYRSYWEFEWAADWEDLSPRVLSEWDDQGAEGESFVTNKIGYKAILDYMRSGIPEHHFIFNATIKNIRYTQNEIILTTTEKEILKNYDYVIVTSSLGHLKKYHKTLFTPPLPRQKVKAIEKIGFGGSCKIFFHWDKPFWQNGTYSIAPLPVEGMARSVVDPFEREMTTLQVVDWQPNTLMAWIAGAGHRIMDDMSEEEISWRITRLIRDMKDDQTIQPPDQIVRTQLTKNELLLGSYSYMSAEQARSRISHSQLGIPVKVNGTTKILFAGEATHYRLFQTAVGAFLSGRREADRLLKTWNEPTNIQFKKTQTAQHLNEEDSLLINDHELPFSISNLGKEPLF